MKNLFLGNKQLFSYVFYILVDLFYKIKKLNIKNLKWKCLQIKMKIPYIL